MSSPNKLDENTAAWQTWLSLQGKSERTIATYERGLRHFMRWYDRIYEQGFDPRKVMPRDIRDWKNYQQVQEKAAPATINRRLVAVSRFFYWAVKRGLAPDNPAEDIRALRLPPREPKAISSQALRRLLREAYTDSRAYALVETLVGTGIRVGELLDLQIGDVRLSARSGRLVIRRGKGDGYREIPLTLDVRKALQAYLNEHPERDNAEAALWLRQDGQPIAHRSSILRILEKYALRAGIDTPSPHQLRHTFATRYLRANPDDLRGLARLLGHTNLNSVMIYTEPNMEDLAERLERVETSL